MNDRYESYLNLLEQVDALVSRFENHPDETTREQAIALLSGLDALHREGLDRLIAILRSSGSAGMIDRLERDPIVRILLGLYDLAELDLPDAPAEPAGFVSLEDIDVIDDDHDML